MGILQETSSINEKEDFNKIDEPLHVEIDNKPISMLNTPQSTEKPTATSTPQIKKEEPKVEELLIPIITITQELDDNNNNNNKIDDNLNKINRAKIVVVVDDDVPSTTTISINKKLKIERTMLNTILVIFIISILFIFILPALVGGNSMYSTVKNILTSSVNSVSLSVKDSLRNSQLLFDPIFSFFLRNYHDI